MPLFIHSQPRIGAKTFQVSVKIPIPIHNTVYDQIDAWGVFLLLFLAV